MVFLGGELIVKKLNIFFLSVMFFLSGCAHASLEEGVIAGKKLSLDSEKCMLTIDNITFNLEMKPRCYFVKQSYPVRSEKVGFKYYDDIDTYVILIVGTSAAKDPEYPLTLKRDDCGEQMQALIIKKGTALLSSKRFSGGLTCAGLGADEKKYWILSRT